MKQAYYSIPLGTIQIGYEKETLFLLNLVETIETENEHSCFTDKIYQQICEYFDGKRKAFDISYALHGTPFQKKVWKVLETIPYGNTMTYGEIAKSLGNPKAARAVGKACNVNPIWLIIPCHRVVGKKHVLTGYAYGLAIKEKLITIEKSWVNTSD